MKYIKTYETYEAVEWNKNINWNYVKKNPDYNSDESRLIKDLQEKIEDVISMLDNDNVLEIEDIKGENLDFGAYAIVSIFGKIYKISEIYSEDYLCIDKFPINNMEENETPGYKGSTKEIAELLNTIYNSGGIEIYQASKKNL